MRKSQLYLLQLKKMHTAENDYELTNIFEHKIYKGNILSSNRPPVDQSVLIGIFHLVQ